MVALNIAVFAFVIEPAATIPWLGYTVALVALAYAVFVWALHPERHAPVLGSSLFTSATDATLITLWILATGGFASPFYPLWYVSIAAIALRFDAKATHVAAGVYALLYLALMGIVGAIHPANASELIVRTAYIGLVGVLGGWLAEDSLRESHAKAAATKTVGRLDDQVRRRTEELAESEARLRRSLGDLETAHARLKELDRLKTLFINTTAHELRTPLTSIKLQLHLLKTAKLGELNDRQRKAAEVLDRNMERLAALVHDVSDAARLQSGRFDVLHQPVELGEILEEVYETFIEPARVKGVSLVILSPDELWVKGDANRLTQVLFNLVSNALKFTPATGSIEIAAEPKAGHALVTVRDDGAGIAGDQIPGLFQPFAQAAAESQRVDGGTGLGLFIAKGIVEHHGGRIWCESPGPTLGAAFHFTVPVTQPDPETPRRSRVAAPV